MIDFFFVGPNVFNVLKYLAMSLTMGFAADILLDSIYAYHTARSLMRRGWARPADSAPRLRLKRGLRVRRSVGSITIFLSVLLISIAEMALEFSTGAESVWTRRIETFRVSRNASNIDSVLRSGPNYVLRMRIALQRVENICFSTEEMWYFPVLFNMSTEYRIQGLGNAARCFQNFSEPIDSRRILNESGFRAGDVSATKMWDDSQLQLGRDVNDAEVTVPYNVTESARVGSLEFYSFLATTFKQHQKPINGTERALSGLSASERKQVALYTAQFKVKSGKSVECLVRKSWKRQTKTGPLQIEPLEIEACLVPTLRSRTIVGLLDKSLLVMSVALDGVKSFHDLKVLRAVPWMIGENNGLHTFRELAILTAISRHMVEGINVDGFEDVLIEVGDKNITVPTWTVWGVVLFVVGMLLLVVAKIGVTLLRRRVNIRGDLGTARGVAENWMLQNEQSGKEFTEGGRVVLVTEKGTENGWTRVTVKREIDFRDTGWNGMANTIRGGAELQEGKGTR